MRNKYGNPHDPYEPEDRRAGRVYVYETVDVEYQDRGANDEGYYYEWCDECNRRTEHDGCCLECS